MIIRIPLPTGEYMEIPEDNMTWEDDLKWLRSFEPKRNCNKCYKEAKKYQSPRGFTVPFKPMTDKEREAKMPFRTINNRMIAIEKLKNGKPCMSINGIINPEKLDLTNF